MDPIAKFKSLGLCDRLAHNLVSNGFESFFEIQELVIPKLMQNNSRRCIQPRHICASAPTGSGKTLAYVVPLLQALQRNHFAEIRLKAIVILPTRELAIQVYDVFTQLSKGLNVSIGIATGQVSVEQERENLVGDSSLLDLGFGCSVVDILVATPGRLQDHLLLTPRFTLEHLRFIVLDEADRLLGNAYHHWVKALVQSSAGSTTHGLDSSLIGTQRRTHQVSTTHTHISTYGHQGDEQSSYLPLSFLYGSRQRSVQRLLFSATLSDNPAKLALLGVRNPLVYRVGGSVLKAGDTETDPAYDGVSFAVAALKDVKTKDSSDNSENDGSDDDDDDDSEGEDNDSDEGSREMQLEDEHGEANNDTEEEVEIDVDQAKDTITSSLLEVRRISQQVALANEKTAAASTSSTAAATQSGAYHLPPGLTESVCVCDTKHRPLALAALLYEACTMESNTSETSAQNTDYAHIDMDMDNENITEDKGSMKKSRKFMHSLRGYCRGANDMIVVFASSVETAHRLAVLLQLLNGQVEDANAPGTLSAVKIGSIGGSYHSSTSDAQHNDDGLEMSTSNQANKKRKVNTASPTHAQYVFNGEVREMSRTLRAAEREETMAACRAGQVRVLVATDQMARGIDLPNIKVVVNYDCPSDVKTYLHRVGRTARGRNEGHALTMLKVGQAGAFHTLHKVILPSEAQKARYTTQSRTGDTDTRAASQSGEATYPMLRSRPDPQIENGPLAKMMARSLKLLPLVLSEWDSGSSGEQRFFLH